MIPVRFRGIAIDSGEYVYGYFCKLKTEKGIKDFIIDESGIKTEIRSDTYQQHIGIDSDNNWIYEGDILTDESDCEYKAVFSLGEAYMIDCKGDAVDSADDFGLPPALWNLKLKLDNEEPERKPDSF